MNPRVAVSGPRIRHHSPYRPERPNPKKVSLTARFLTASDVKKKVILIIDEKCSKVDIDQKCLLKIRQPTSLLSCNLFALTLQKIVN